MTPKGSPVTSEEQARAIAERIADLAMMPSGFVEPLDVRDELINEAESLIAAALRTREAETWEQAAQECYDQARRDTHTANGFPSASYMRQALLQKADAADVLCERLRARAAQPQETEKA